MDKSYSSVPSFVAANLSDHLLEPEKSFAAYENVLRHNPNNVNALTQMARIYQSRQQFTQARHLNPLENWILETLSFN